MADSLRFRQVYLRSPEGEDVFQDLDWTLPQGGRVRLDPGGASGATALLRLAAGLATPETGEVLLEGVAHRAGGFHHPSLALGRVGWVPTNGGLLVNQSLLANVALPLRAVGGLPRATAEAEARLWLDRAGLLACADRRPHAMDPVQGWLTALARTAASRPAIWLVDRPPSNLADHEAGRALALLRGGLAAGDTALVVDPSDGWAADLPECCHLAEGRLRPGSAP